MDEWPTIGMGNLEAMMVLRKHVAPEPSINGFDPYQSMLNRKRNNMQNEDGYINDPVEQYDPNDVRALQEFCQQYGILGFNCGNMSPRSALTFLKAKMGVRETETPSYSKKVLYG